MESRNLIQSSEGCKILFCDYVKHLYIYNAKENTYSEKIETIFDAGASGHRVGYSDSQNILVAAAYERYGIIGYSSNGEEIWRNSQKKTQYIDISRDGSIAYCGINDGPLRIINIADGKNIDKLNGVRRVVESIDGDWLYVDANIPKIKNKFSNDSLIINRKSFAILDISISAKNAVYSEAGGKVTCINIFDKDVLWRYSPQPGSHVLKILRYNEILAAVEWPFQRGGNKDLIIFDEGSGKIAKRLNINNINDICVNKFKNEFILTNRNVIDINAF